MLERARKKMPNSFKLTYVYNAYNSNKQRCTIYELNLMREMKFVLFICVWTVRVWCVLGTMKTKPNQTNEKQFFCSKNENNVSCVYFWNFLFNLLYFLFLFCQVFLSFNGVCVWCVGPNDLNVCNATAKTHKNILYS